MIVIMINLGPLPLSKIDQGGISQDCHSYKYQQQPKFLTFSRI